MRSTVVHHGAASMAWGDARLLAHRLAAPLPAELVPLADAAGRTLATPVRAAAMLPGFDNAAMDGYAVRGIGPWRLTGLVLAGQAATSALADGDAVEIATGAPTPAGADRIVPYEDAERIGDDIHGPAAGRSHLRRAGEYVRIGHEVLAAGTVLGAAALGLAAAVGVDHLAVRRRARIRLLVTGDEITTAGVPAYGKVRDAIGPTVAALLRAWGAEPDCVQQVPDNPEALTRAITAAPLAADVTLVCGASSVGPADHLHGTLRTLGADVHIDGVACRPGHPQVLAHAATGWIVGLPGNPYAALVAAFTIVQPLLAGLAGRPVLDLPRAPLTGNVHNDGVHTRIVPVRWHGNEVQVIDGAQPGQLNAVAHADALAVVRPQWTVGSTAELLGLPG